MKKSRLMALAACLVIGGTGFWFLAGQADGDGSPADFPILNAVASGGGMLHAMTARLDLSDSQQQKIKTIISNEAAKDEPTINQLKGDIKSLRALSESNNIDPAQLKSVAQSSSVAAVDLVVDLAQTKSRIFAVLTPSQRAQARQMQESGAVLLRDRLSSMQSDRGHMLRSVADKLDLTDDQKSQALSILSAEKAATRPEIMKIAQDLKEVQKLTAGSNCDKSVVRAQAEKAQQPVEALIVDTVQTRSQLRALLTPEQRTKAEMMGQTLRSRLARRLMNGFQIDGPYPADSGM